MRLARVLAAREHELMRLRRGRLGLADDIAAERSHRDPLPHARERCSAPRRASIAAGAGEVSRFVTRLHPRHLVMKIPSRRWRITRLAHTVMSAASEAPRGAYRRWVATAESLNLLLVTEDMPGYLCYDCVRPDVARNRR